MKREHGGPDAQGVPVWDFSSNANACGPCPQVLDAVQRADARHYPDPAYSDLRSALAEFHSVDVDRIVLASSASEFIFRMTACLARSGLQRVWYPAMCYGEYPHAAKVWGLERVLEPAQADLLWLCEPSSPLGAADAMVAGVRQQQGVVVLDRAYEPLRLSGQCSLQEAALDDVWQLWSPNKALGLTGIRGAYAIAPLNGRRLAQSLEQQAASWPLGAHAVTMLRCWTHRDTQHWLAQSLETLRFWKAAQLAMLQRWTCLPSDANFFCVKAAFNPVALRAQGVKLRDTASFGLPGHWRLSVQTPAAQAALQSALESEGAV
ncbi:aminotransferase class I/II-fold pyridoxal phosphate-dependent enzyme [Noviherbaspirillum sedimenti]|uniref:histidinol-phosphate transaminase n=1 Tax=Noviherbaspirillum sedimenti TaxID=2320865 RepID=A0A3A3FXA8_9BURK|nr:aminotransferase class I/II-fold pyridoxal phosphate-dependent enzyme [Noviherbaspirillum sedimenti]RJG00354.1 aminotransferase class I/II-fold pyridoxal phosphate-dependent enzyme [Noviherbaspirillum sedimenti]